MEHNTNKNKKNTESFNVIRVFYYLSVLTVSFDVIMVVNTGFNYRATQLFLLPPMLICYIWVLSGKKVKWPIGFNGLVLWSIYIVTFIPNTTFIMRSVGYALWLVFNVSTIFITVQLFDSYEKVESLIRWYLYSFLFVAIFGLVQFFMPIFHLGSFLVQAWWVPGFVPRVSGFSYEPSFFATYMLMGWIMTAYLLRTRSDLVNNKWLRFIYIILTLAMLLSSSRMGWFIMVLWFAQYPIFLIIRLARGKINKRYFWYSVAMLIVSILLINFVTSELGFDNVRFLFQGLGIFGTASHSSGTRISEFLDTFQIFLNSPIMGYSLGGISSAIGELRGVTVDSIALAKENEGMSVFTEVLAASGVIGFIPFAYYMITLMIKPIRLANRINDSETKKLLIAVTLALIFELIILQLNQTILRPYLWLHIAILSALYSIALKKNRETANANAVN